MGVGTKSTSQPWWLNEQIRLIQTNLREIDINLDPEKLVRDLKDFSANVVLFNVGGIVANYETDLEYHYRNPYLQDEVLSEIIRHCKAADIRFMARFDFSKVHETLAKQRPEWLYVSEAGNHNNYNGQVQTCVSGAYQQEYSLKILSEVIERYDIDSVFFNMTGYQRDDYDRNYLGICQCDACRTSFLDRTGLELPAITDTNNPAFVSLERFSLDRTNEQYDQINRHIKGLNPDIAVCTYTSRGVDIWRKEAATTFERNLEWNYESSMRVKSVLPVFSDKTVSNAAVHFVSRRFRYSGASPNLTALRLAENIANAAPLDFFVMGTLSNQMDRSSFATVKELFAFYEENQDWYKNVEQFADVCIIHPEANYVFGAQDEFYGLVRMLAEQHVLYDIWPEEFLERPDASDVLAKYPLVVIGEARCLAPSVMAALDAYVAGGGTVISTGQTATYDQQGRPTDKSWLASSGISKIRSVEPRKNSAYFYLDEQDKLEFDGFADVDVVFVYGETMKVDLQETARGWLSYIPPHMHGPPEKCYFTPDIITNDPGVIVNTYGSGRFVTVPFGLGTHYQKYGNHAHFDLFERLISKFSDQKLRLSTDASPLIEVNAQCHSSGDWALVSLVNHNGQNGHAFHPPEAIYNTEVTIEPGFDVAEVLSLRSGESLAFGVRSNGVTFCVPQIDLFDTIVLRKAAT